MPEAANLPEFRYPHILAYLIEHIENQVDTALVNHRLRING